MSEKCYLPKNALENDQRQGCLYTASGEIACNYQGDSVSLILSQKPTFATNVVDRRYCAAQQPQTNTNKVIEGFTSGLEGVVGNVNVKVNELKKWIHQ